MELSLPHQRDVPVSITQQLQDHLDFLEGRVACILILFTFHPQRPGVNIGSCPSTEVLLLETAEW